MKFCQNVTKISKFHFQLGGGIFKSIGGKSTGGKSKSKSTSIPPYKGPSDDGYNGGDPFTENIDFFAMSNDDVDQRFEQLLVRKLSKLL